MWKHSQNDKTSENYLCGDNTFWCDLKHPSPAAHSWKGHGTCLRELWHKGHHASVCPHIKACFVEQKVVLGSWSRRCIIIILLSVLFFRHTCMVVIHGFKLYKIFLLVCILTNGWKLVNSKYLRCLEHSDGELSNDFVRDCFLIFPFV